MRKTRLVFMVMLALLAVSAISAIVWSQTIRQTRLDADTMRAALRTTTIEEEGFIDYVLAKVNKGQLPACLVDSTFQWARKKPYKHRFQYFKQALIVRADSIGIKI